MFRQTWKIYLPVIIILIKKSATGEQSLSMNHTDFERAAGGRKIKFSFSAIEINNGRIPISSKLTPLASDLVMLLQEDDQSKKLLANRKFEFAMSNDFMLAIRDITVAVETN